MNMRIKKKIEKRLKSSMQQFDTAHGGLHPVAKTYREIKIQRKRFRSAMMNCRHITYQLHGYSYQLRICRRLRKDWGHAWSVKFKNFKKEIG